MFITHTRIRIFVLRTESIVLLFSNVCKGKKWGFWLVLISYLSWMQENENVKLWKDFRNKTI